MPEEKQATVLIVEDERDLARTYRAALEDDHVVRVATGGAEGLEKLDDAVDVVLLDRRMPGMSGDEMLAELHERGFDCRVVMVTAVDPDTDLLHMEFDEYLVKPVAAEDLRNAVERMLARDVMEERIREMFALASKLATLEMKLDIDQQERSEQHQQLLEDFYTLREEVDLSGAEDDYYSEATLKKLRSLLDE